MAQDPSSDSVAIALPSFDDDDEQEELFSYGAPSSARFGQTPASSSFAPSSFSAPTVESGGYHNPYGGAGGGGAFGGHQRGLSSASSGGDQGAYGGRKDSVAASNTSYGTSGGGDSGFNFPQNRNASSTSVGGSSSSYGQQRNGSSSASSSGITASKRNGSFSSTPYPPPPPPQVTKKGSFVSLKSAFAKGSAALAASAHHPGIDRSFSSTGVIPPLPEPSQSNYPALRNPFSRTASSSAGLDKTGGSGGNAFSPSPSLQALGSGGGATKRKGSRPSGGGGGRHAASNSRYSHYSTASSAGNNFAFSRSITASPPPIPSTSRRNPTSPNRQHIPSQSFSSLANSTSSFRLPPPTTPPQYALHLLLALFHAHTTHHLTMLISATSHPLSAPAPLMKTILGPGVDEKLDGVLESLGVVAASGGGAEAKGVLESLYKWKSQVVEDVVGRGSVRSHLTGSQASIGVTDAAAKLNERVSLASMYIFLRVILSIVSRLSKDSLGEALGTKLEDMLWRYVTVSREEIRDVPNRTANRELLCEVLGALANIRFLTVTDRFLVEIQRGVAAIASASAGGLNNKADKELEARMDAVIRAMKTFKLKVYPPEAFDDGAEFLLELATLFAQSHGSTVKIAFADVLVALIHPIVNTATAEVNHPQWAKAIGIIFSQATKMAQKEKYWSTGYPLIVTCLCVSPPESFLEQWMPTWNSSLLKLKDLKARPIIANGTLRLLWMYLIRCDGQQSNSAVVKSIDTILRTLFPLKQRQLQPPDLPLDVFVSIMHLVLLRQFDSAQDYILHFLAEDRLGEGGRASATTTNEELQTPERMTIAIKAVLLTLRSLEKDVRVPDFPSTYDFSSFDFSSDHEASGEILPESFFAKPGMTDFFDRVGPLIGHVAILADRDVGSMSVLDSRFLASRTGYRELSDSASRSTDLGSVVEGGTVVVKHGLLYVSHRRELRPTFDLLRSVFVSWPRCLHFSIDINKTLEILSRGTSHVSPELVESASSALQRVASIKGKAEPSAVAYARFLVGWGKVFREGQVGVKAYEQQVERMGKLWVDLLELWAKELRAADEADRIPVELNVLAEVESSALFFLSSISRNLRALGVAALRLISELQTLSVPADDHQPRGITVLENEGSRPDVLSCIPSAAISGSERHRLDTTCKPSVPPEILLRWAESDNSTDQHLWHLFFPTLVVRLQEYIPNTMEIFRVLVGRTFLNWKSTISNLNGMKSAPATPNSKGGAPSSSTSSSGSRPLAESHHLAEQWRVLLTILCSTTTPAGEGQTSPVLQSSSSQSDLSHLKDLEAERLFTSTVLFQQVIPLLNSENVRFRDAVVTALGHISQPIFWPLIQNLQSITRHLHDDFQTRDRSNSNPSMPSQRRRGPQTRLFIAVAHVFMRVSPLIKDPRSIADVNIVSAMLQFVRETYQYLNERDVREDWELHRLRRYFCVVVMNVADGLANLPQSDRYLTPELRAAVYNICDDWCNLGRRADVTQARESKQLIAAADSYRNERDKGSMLTTLSTDTRMLSVAAARAMAALCQGSIFFEPDRTNRTRTPSGREIEPAAVLQWIRGLFSASSSASGEAHEIGSKALSSLVEYNSSNPALLDAVLYQSSVEGDQFGLKRSFFSIVVDAIGSSARPLFSFAQKACLALIKLGHPDVGFRRRAFELFEYLLPDDVAAIARYQPAIGSSAPTIYLQAQRQLAQHLADRYSSESAAVISECTMRLTNIEAGRRPVILAIIPAFLGKIDLEPTPDDYDDLDEPAQPSPASTYTSYLILSSLLFIAVRFGDGNTTELQNIWTSLASGPYERNCNAIIKFLIQQSSRRCSLEFVGHAKQVIASLAESHVGPVVFEDLCGFIEPSAMVQSPALDEPRSPGHDGSPPRFVPDLDALFPLPTKPQPLTTGQLALFFLGEMMLERTREPALDVHLPILLHATLTLVDHASPLIRDQAQTVLFQILWAWTCDEGQVDTEEEWLDIRQTIGTFWEQRSTLFWTQDPSETLPGQVDNIPSKMSILLPQILDLFQPFHPDLKDVWGELAVDWGTSCPNRHLACRSFEIFRVLTPVVTERMLADMLGRLSNTIADPSVENNAFCREILYSFCGIVHNWDAEAILAHPQLFWCAAACLSTTVESEFAVVLDLLENILDRLDLSDSMVVETLLEHQPPHWYGDDLRLQKLLLPGVRSSETDLATFGLLGRLAKIERPTLVDFAEERTFHLFVVSLPFCLHHMDAGELPEAIVFLTLDLARIAESEGKNSINRIMTSFAKSRFRTKDDFLRQAVGCLREHFLPRFAFELVHLLLGLTLNARDWMREKTMLVLKLLLQYPDAREPLAIYGAELLMPLLHLLGTPFALQALEVLNEPIVISGGPAANQVLRMSMSFGAAMTNVGDHVGEVFGIPAESGWCVAKIDEQSACARQNALAVFETCNEGARVQSSAHFSMQFTGGRGGLEGYAGSASQLSLDSYATSQSVTEETTLSQLVGDLHALNQFFNEEDEDAPGPYDLTRQPNGVSSDTASQRRVSQIIHRSMQRSGSISSLYDIVPSGSPSHRHSRSLTQNSITNFPPSSSPSFGFTQQHYNTSNPALSPSDSSDSTSFAYHGHSHSHSYSSSNGGGGSSTGHRMSEETATPPNHRRPSHQHTQSLSKYHEEEEEEAEEGGFGLETSPVVSPLQGTNGATRWDGGGGNQQQQQPKRGLRALLMGRPST